MVKEKSSTSKQKSSVLLSIEGALGPLNCKHLLSFRYGGIPIGLRLLSLIEYDCPLADYILADEIRSGAYTKPVPSDSDSPRSFLSASSDMEAAPHAPDEGAAPLAAPAPPADMADPGVAAIIAVAAAAAAAAAPLAAGVAADGVAAAPPADGIAAPLVDVVAPALAAPMVDQTAANLALLATLVPMLPSLGTILNTLVAATQMVAGGNIAAPTTNVVPPTTNATPSDPTNPFLNDTSPPITHSRSEVLNFNRSLTGIAWSSTSNPTHALS